MNAGGAKQVVTFIVKFPSAVDCKARAGCGTIINTLSTQIQRMIGSVPTESAEPRLTIVGVCGVGLTMNDHVYEFTLLRFVFASWMCSSNFSPAQGAICSHVCARKFVFDQGMSNIVFVARKQPTAGKCLSSLNTPVGGSR
jgi:hypothetical protein